MKNTGFSFLATAVLPVFLMSCVSMKDRVMTPQEQEQATIIDTVTDKITVFQLFHIRNENRIKTKVYRELMNIARRKYQGDIEIRNITITGGYSGLEGVLLASSVGVGAYASYLAFIFSARREPITHEGNSYGYTTVHDPKSALIGIPIALGINLIGNSQRLTATGDVVAIGDVVLIDSGPDGSTAPVPANVPSNTPTPSNAPAPGKAPAPGANF